MEKPYGSIQSPGYPYPTQERRICKWAIKTSPGSRIRVVFHQFQIVGAQRTYLKCHNQYLKLDDPSQIANVTMTNAGRTTDTEKTTTFCGDIVPSEITSTSNELIISYSADGSEVNGNHFWLSWSTIGCGGTISQNNTEITVDASDFVPFNLSDGRECLWQVNGPVGYYVKLDVTGIKFDTSKCSNESKNYNSLDVSYYIC